MSKNLVNEATGVFVGTLQEDMVDTVKRTKRLCCDVYIPEFYSEASDYPLTYVPLWSLSLPLKKGDKVLVTFSQNNLLHPVLYKNDDEVDKGFYEKFDISKSGETSENTVGAIRVGDDSYLITTDSYTVLHKNKGFILINKNNEVYTYGSKIVFQGGDVIIKSEAMKDVSIESGNNVNIESGASGKIAIKNATVSLKTLIKDIFGVLQHLVTPASLVAPNGPVTYTQVGGDLPTIIMDSNFTNLLLND